MTPRLVLLALAFLPLIAHAQSAPAPAAQQIAAS
jgi:hypothetical protein